jgi:hypothetical protein
MFFIEGKWCSQVVKTKGFEYYDDDPSQLGDDMLQANYVHDVVDVFMDQ